MIRLHVAVPVQNYLKEMNWEVLSHPLYSTDITPSNYHLFRSLQSALSGERLNSFEDNKTFIDSWIHSKDEDFSRRGIPFLPERWEKVIANNGQYF